MSAFLRDGEGVRFLGSFYKSRFAPRIQVSTFADMREIVIAGQGSQRGASLSAQTRASPKVFACSFPSRRLGSSSTMASSPNEAARCRRRRAS